VKRTLIVMAGVAALCTAIYVSNKLWAQTPGGAGSSSGGSTAAGSAAQPKTKVALLNLRYVVENYNKYKLYQEDFKKVVEPFSARDTGLKTDGENLAKEAQKPTTTTERREQIEKQMKELQRKIEDNKNEAQKVIVKKQEEQLRTLYMDVRGVVERYAQAHGFEMVLHYNDTFDDKDYWSGPNIARKMQAGACMPMYIARGLDISQNVLSTLNASCPAPTPSSSGSTGNTGTPASRPGG